MKNIFLGMLFVFLNFHLDIETIRIGLIPTFLGYIFMAYGLSQLAGYSSVFSSVLPYVRIMVLYSGICYVLDITGLSFSMGEPINYILSIIATFASLFISYRIIAGIKDVEARRAQSLNSGQLYFAWKLLAIFSGIVYLMYIIPVLALISVIAVFITGIYYLYVFSQTKNLFYKENAAV